MSALRYIGRLSQILLVALLAGALMSASGCSGGSPAKLPVGAAGTSGTCKVSAPQGNGQPCGCAADCQSGFCVEGVCCTSACTEACKTCNLPEARGTCTSLANGVLPRTPGACVKSEASTCGSDGTCDGTGGCRKYLSGTECQSGTCDGASVAGAGVCDGAGRCRPGPDTVCSPFSCDAKTSACFDVCTSDAECSGGGKCVAGSCGAKRAGASCKKNGDCASGFCADDVCCNVACQGSCVSCGTVGRIGTCWPVDQGQSDPHGVCKEEGATSCGKTGTCDGFGGCTLYAAETICTPPACAGERLETAGTCNGLGACRAPGVQNCWPYRCKGNACATKCAVDDDCQPGHACVDGSCGPKPPGQTCAAATECASGFCVDGVCCADACEGACKSCALPSSMGRCAPVAGGTADPRAVCKDQGVASCGTNGTCDGAGGCRKYKEGSECKPEHCEGKVYTPASTCNSTGQCAEPASLPCTPFACNGARCFTSCGSNADCVAPNTCDMQGSCGKKGNGSFCSDAVECASGFCAQGVCCSSTCASACKSCALAGTRGQCTNVATSAPDPSGTCVVQAASTCGTNGMCEAGACQRYPQGAPCADASCAAGSSTFMPASTCDGAGTCVMPASTSCAPYKCGAAACKATCTADADCVAPSLCVGGSCGLKSPGATCGDGSECATGFCAQGVCCRTSCAGTCMSCALNSAPGTCSPVAAGGFDPTGTCKDMGAASCATTGACDGKGACQLYAAGTVCVAPSCPAGGATAMLARTCDGAGACRAASTLPCAPFACSGTTCAATCLSDASCAPPNICDLKTNLCGDKKRLGQSCATSAECLSGNFCVDGVCCASTSCGTCQACNIGGSAGTCVDVPADAADPHNRCVAAPPCGLTGTCSGAGGMCKIAPATTACGAASCMGSTYTPAGFCNGAGACTQTPLSCSPFVCGAGACLATCAGDGDCVAGSSCVAGSCSSLHPNGTACTSGPQCLSGHCVGQVCCGSASCPSCFSCSVAGSAGACAPVPAGGSDPLGQCAVTAASTCGTSGTCNGNGACALYVAGTPCAPQACKGKQNLAAASTCNGAGVCMAGAQTSCSPWACAGSACKVAPCAADTDCAPGKTCNVGTGACQ